MTAPVGTILIQATTWAKGVTRQRYRFKIDDEGCSRCSKRQGTDSALAPPAGIKVPPTPSNQLQESHIDSGFKAAEDSWAWQDTPLTLALGRQTGLCEV